MFGCLLLLCKFSLNLNSIFWRKLSLCIQHILSGLDLGWALFKRSKTIDKSFLRFDRVLHGRNKINTDQLDKYLSVYAVYVAEHRYTSFNGVGFMDSGYGKLNFIGKDSGDILDQGWKWFIKVFEALNVIQTLDDVVSWVRDLLGKLTVLSSNYVGGFRS